MGTDDRPLAVLTPEKGLLFRITHRRNVPWILRNGLHCRNSECLDPDFRSIGNQDLIARRRDREVPIEPGGRLSHYIPFYFTPCTPMLLNILTGFGAVTREAADDIVVLVARLPMLLDAGIRCITTDRHAVLETAKFFDGRAGLGHVDWQLLQGRDFRRDPTRSDKLERYQAEAMIHGSMSADLLAGMACSSETVQRELASLVAGASLGFPVTVRPTWYWR